MRWQDESIWQTLELEATGDERSIKRAYAKLLKKNRPEDDPQAFQALRESYERALEIAAWLREAAATERQPTATPAPAKPEPESPADAELEVESPAQPHEIAAQLWQEFVGQSDVLQASSLTRLFTNPALTNLNVRDAFEFYCAQYCADEQADAEMRKTIVEFFKWHQDASHLLKMHPSIPQLALERYYADVGYSYLDQLRLHGNKQLQLLMADSLPRFNLLQLANRKFVMEMREALYHLNWKFPEVVRYKLNPDVLDGWHQKLLAKRYFVQTFFASLMFGAGLFLLLYFCFDTFELLEPEMRGFSSFWLGQFISVAGFAWFSISPPETLLRLWKRLRDEILYKPIHVYRYQLKTQTAWLIPLFLLPLLLLLKPLPGWLEYLFIFGSVLTCAWSLYAASIAFRLVHYFAASVFGLTGMLFFHMLGQQQFFQPAGFMLGVAFGTLVLRGGKEILYFLSINKHTQTKLQLAWLVICCLVLAIQNSAYASALSTVQIQAWMLLTWLLLCAPGFLLVNIFPCRHSLANGLLLFSIAHAAPLMAGYLRMLENLPERVTPLQVLILMQAMLLIFNLLYRLFIQENADQ